MNQVSADKDKNPLRRVLFLAISGAYLNSVVYGFSYGAFDHEFQLPLINWLRDPSLYPQDPIRDALARFPTIYWPAIAYLSHWISPERAAFLFFLLTKLLFFLALARIVAARVKEIRLAACIVLSIAASPLLNDQTPLGASVVLQSIQTHGTLAIAWLLWVGCLLLEERWIPATLLCALTVYLDALYFVFTLSAFALFAAFDWRRRKRMILTAGLVGAAISLPWLLLSRGVSYMHFPSGYVEALLAFYPFLLNLHSHEAYELVSGAGLLLAAGLMCVVARKSGQRREVRLEILAASFLVPVSLGGILGECHLTPFVARLQLLRADTFLLLYAILLLQVYGANLMPSAVRGPATTFLLSAAAILMPLSESVGLLWLVFIDIALWADPGEHFEQFMRRLASVSLVRPISLGLLSAGIIAAWWKHAEWSMSVVIALAILVACVFEIGNRTTAVPTRPGAITASLAGVAIILLTLSHVPGISRIWNPAIAPTALESNWRAVQEWAKASTPLDAVFLVPTSPGGFRAFSERSSWGEWRDGQAMYLYPPFEEEYRKRMTAVGYSWGKWNGTEAITETYKHLSWERLSAIARQNHLSYIIQFQAVTYPVTPIFANEDYAVYKVAY